MSNVKTIGILGGMGPESTLYLFRQIVKLTDARSDQEHIRILVDNHTSIPDRSDFILGRGPDPVPAMLESAGLLERMGADFLLIACNTAHYFLDRMEPRMGIPVLHMIRSVARALKNRNESQEKAGLLSTLGTYRTNIYTSILEEEGIEVIVPGEDDRKRVMDSIYGKKGIKAGYIRENAGILEKTGRKLMEAGAGLVISGCTEISLVAEQHPFSFPSLCPMKTLAAEAVTLAGYPLRKEQE